MNASRLLPYGFALLFWLGTSSALAREAIELNEHCVVNILNRTIYANANGDFIMDNIPSMMGKIRARATCE